ncbi:MAG: SDR family oxidoreductase [Aureispira sp.]|nr:SDR family oxidoreductase [Aureispira sp.]
MKYNVLITGASGYVGQNVLKRLHKDLEAGKIHSLVAGDIKDLPKSKQLEGVHYVKMDVTNKELWKTFEQFEITTVVHLAAILDSQSAPREFQYQVDVVGTQNILDACVKTGARRVIISSSGAAYGYYADNPEWLRETDPARGNEAYPYSDHKRLIEEMLAKYRKEQPQLKQVVFRIGTVIGANTDNLITNLFEKKTVLGLAGYKSPFVFAWDEDVANAMQYAVFSEKTGVYNLVGDGAISNSDIAKIQGKRYLPLPAFLIKGALGVLHPLGITRYGPKQLLFLQYRPVLDNTKLKEEFGYIPEKTSLEAFTYYLRENGKQVCNLKKIKVLKP